MSVSTQFAPGTPFPTEFLDMNIFESCFAENLSKTQDHGSPGNAGNAGNLTSSTSSSVSIADSPRNSSSTARSTPPPDISPSTPTSPSLFSASITKDCDVPMDGMWGHFHDFNHSEFNPVRNDFLDDSPATHTHAAYMFPQNSILPSSLTAAHTLEGGHPSRHYSAIDAFSPTRTPPYPPFPAASYQADTSLHDQITPPSVDPDPVFTEDIFGEHRTKFGEDGDNGPVSHRKRSSSIPTKRSTSPNSSARKSRKTVAPSLDAEEEEEVKAAKRRKFLERNRVAASKCRQKKKAWMQQLEETARNAQSDSKLLHQTVGILKNELLILKSELLKHHECDCEKIRAYLLREADKVAEGTVGSALSPIRPRQFSLVESEASDLFNEGTELDMFDDELEDFGEVKVGDVSRMPS